MLLTDFRAAFPSVFVSWVIAVLSRMGFPLFVVSFFSMLYELNVGNITMAGQRFSRLPILRRG